MPVTKPRSPIRRKLREKVADAILDAAEEVALEAGLGGMTISAVAERAGVAVGTLYNYFPDRDAILAALFRARRASLEPMIAEAAKEVARRPFEQRLREFVRRMFVAFEYHERFLRVAALADRDGAKVNRNTALLTEIVGELEKIMREGARAKLFPAARAPIYARMLHGMLRSMFLWQLSTKHINSDCDLVVETFLHGVMPRWRVDHRH